jgi:hypothetical protein
MPGPLTCNKSKITEASCCIFPTSVFGERFLHAFVIALQNLLWKGDEVVAVQARFLVVLLSF